MSNLVLQCKEGGDYRPHPEGIYAAFCADVIHLGLVESEFQGEKKLVNKVRLIFESECKTEDGRHCTIAKNFTASLHPKAKLCEFLGKWRGRPVVPGESIDLEKLIGASCTLVISHQQNMVGRTYATIDAVSKPTRKVVPSGTYDPVATRQRIAEWNAKQQAGGQTTEDRGQRTAAGQAKACTTNGGGRQETGQSRPQDHGIAEWNAKQQASGQGQVASGGQAKACTTNGTGGQEGDAGQAKACTTNGGGALPPKSGAPGTAPVEPEVDPEVGF